jgi:Uma2 family endonuclease
LAADLYEQGRLILPGAQIYAMPSVMNKPLLTRAAEGLDRWGWTNANIQRLVDAGVLDEDAPMELIGGEIVPMNAELNAHAKMRWRLHSHFLIATHERVRPALLVGTEISIFLFEDTEFRPDVCIFPAAMNTEHVRGGDLLLAIEVAFSSHQRDLEIKPPIYAKSGVKELWVVDVDSARTIIHRGPSELGFRSIDSHSFAESISSLAFPDIPVRIADFL